MAKKLYTRESGNLNESGFVQRFANSPVFQTVSDKLRDLSSLGMRYGDMVVKQSKSVGATEAAFAAEGPMPEDLLYTLAYADIGAKRMTAYFDKDYRGRRDFLRKFAMNGEIEFILDTIADEGIVYDDKNFFCKPDTTNVAVYLDDKKKDDIVDSIHSSFKKIYTYFHFGDTISAWQYFKQFCIDGFLAWEIIYNEEGNKIIGFKEIDPASIRPAVEKTESGWTQVWHQYEESPQLARKLSDAQIIYISYSKGAFASRVSYTERLVRSFNLLRIMENTRVIWNLMNATYRLKMIVPIGSKSPQKAKESLAELMAMYKEDIYLDYDSGELSINGKPSMQFYKNYMMPSKAGESPDIQTISAEGPDLSKTDALKYFYDKLKQDSKLPFSRFMREEGSSPTIIIGGDGQDYDEIRFYKFINRLRSNFQECLLKPLWIQISLDHPELRDDELFRANLGLRFNKDNLFERLKTMDVLTKEMDFVNNMASYMDDTDSAPFFSRRWLVEKFMSLDRDDYSQNTITKDDDVAKNADAADDAGF